VTPVRFPPIPQFPAERFAALRPGDVRHKRFDEAINQLAEEGLLQVFMPQSGFRHPVVGVVGALQFDVLADRIRTEYNIPVQFEATQYQTARWVEANDALILKKFGVANESALADDHTGAPVFLARNAWHLERTGKDFPEVRFLKTREQTDAEP
jgi:peptide chain release factor 3